MESKIFLFRFAQMFELEKGSPCKPIGVINICWFFGLILERHWDTKWACFFPMDPVAVRGLKTSPYCPLKGDHPFGNLHLHLFCIDVTCIDSILSYVFSSTSWEFRWFHQVFSHDFFDRKMVWLHHPDKGGDPERCLAAEDSGWVQMF